MSVCQIFSLYFGFVCRMLKFFFMNALEWLVYKHCNNIINLNKIKFIVLNISM